MVAAIVSGGWLGIRQAAPNPCDVLTEKHMVNVGFLSDLSSTGARPSLEAAVRVAFTQVGMPRQIHTSDLDPVIDTRGNLIHVGVDGYWVVIGKSDQGYLSLGAPRPCSILE